MADAPLRERGASDCFCEYKDLAAQVGGFLRSGYLTLARQLGFSKAGTPGLIANKTP